MWTVNDGTGDLLVHNTAIFEYEPTEGELYVVSGPLDYDFDEWKIQLRLGTDVQSGGDVTAPMVSSVEVMTETVIKVQFNEDVDPVSAETLSNYSISGGITVEQAAVHSIVKSQVFLTVSYLQGGNYELTIQNIGDLIGNVMTAPVIMPFSTTYGVEDPASETTVSIYPNPASDLIHIKGLDKVTGNITVSLYGIAGIRVFMEQIEVNGNKSHTINTGNLESGLYILEIRGDENISRTKLMIR